MRQIYIDLTTDKAPSSAGSFIGYIGEHNATELLISIPQTMVNKSDYQVLVFQSGPMVFRSGRITEDNTKNTYRDGNTIHSLISKSLTRVTALSIQVECYKEDFNGEASLVGKTQTVPNLMLKPSPDGFPAFNYDGSYEDIDKAIDNAHKHDNLEVLHKFGMDDDGALTFDGYAVGSSAVKTYNTPSEFPETAKIGTIAFAENDDEEVVVTDTPIAINTLYERLRFKQNPDVNTFGCVKDFVERSSSDIKLGAATCQYGLVNEKEEVVGCFAVSHIDRYMSLGLTTPNRYQLTKMSYGKDEKYRNVEQMLFLYNAHPAFVIDGIPEPLDVGWYLICSKEGNFTLGTSNLISSDNIVSCEKLDETHPIFDVYSRVGIIALTTTTNPDLESQFLSKIFECVGEPVKHKGLYIYNHNGWISFEDYINSSTKIVSTFADLPDDCPVGTLAHVINDGYQLTAVERTQFHVGARHPEIHFAPYPPNDSFLFDFSIHGIYVEDGITYKGEFDVESLLDSNIIVVMATKSWNTTSEDVFVYSFIEQTLTHEGITGHLYAGWNKIVFLPDDSVFIKSVTDIGEIPVLRSNEEATTNYGYQISEITINGNSTNSLYTYLFSPTALAEKDNGAGLWVKCDDGWMKIDNPEEFIMKEIELDV